MDIFRLIWTGMLLRFKVFLMFYCWYSAAAYHIISYETLPIYLQGKDKFIIFVSAVVSSYIFMSKSSKPDAPKVQQNQSFNILKPGQKIN